MTVRYNVTDASNHTQLYLHTPDGGGLIINGAVMFDKVVIDGTEVPIADLDTASGKTQLSVGEHTVKYTLKDPTIVGVGYDEEGVPSRVGAIFGGCYDVISVEIPNSVSIIGLQAFYQCAGLTSVTIPNSVTSIERGAFGGCSGLTSLSIGNSVTSIGTSAFENCRGLISVTIPDSVTSIGVEAFRNCRNLTSVVLPSSVTSIGDSAFCGCDSLDEASEAAVKAVNQTATMCEK